MRYSSTSLKKWKRGEVVAGDVLEGSEEELRRAAVMKEEKELARQLGVPLSAILEMLEDDCAASDIEDETEGTERPGTLYKIGTIDSYLAAIAELYETHRTNGINTHPLWRGPAISGLIQSQRRAQDQNN
jgi:hypothetical protein